MNLNQSFKLDGSSFDLETLLEYCEKQIAHPDQAVWKREVYAFIRLFFDPELGEITQYTSGTTGDPGRHGLQRERMVESAKKTLTFFKLMPGDRVLMCLPIRYIAGKMMVVRALVGGLDLILVEPSSSPLGELSDPLSFAAMVPLQVHESLVHGDKLALISTLLIGGGELPYPIKRDLECLSHTAVFESFGMTETYTHFALKRINGTGADLEFRLLDGVSIELDSRKCLVVQVEGITRGPVITNDLVEIGPSGDTFKWLGRYDHVINTGGIKVIPELIEEQIKKVIACECLLLSEPDDRLGNRLVLLVESPLADPPMESWMSQMRSSLSTHELPKRIVVMKEIPRNPSMKPDRIAARRILAGI